jgi:uncharacterized membrane protein YcaP (DUF421 family)
MDVGLRAAIMFVFLWGVTRAVGRSTLGELSTFELLLYVVLGDLIQQAVTQQDYSLTGGMTAISVFAVLTVLLSWAQWRFPRLRRAINGGPVVVLRDGRLIERAMREQRLSDADLIAAARQQGIRDLAELDLAVLEADGKISFFRAESRGESGAPETADVS